MKIFQHYESQAWISPCQSLLKQTVGQAVHISTDSPPHHGLDLGSVLAGCPPLSPGPHQEAPQLAALTAHLLSSHPGRAVRAVAADWRISIIYYFSGKGQIVVTLYKTSRTHEIIDLNLEF